MTELCGLPPPPPPGRSRLVPKPRLRLKRSGWFFFGFSYLSFYGKAEVWVGPFPSIEKAYQLALRNPL